MSTQFSNLVAAMGFQGAGQIAFAAGNVAHRADGRSERTNDAAHDQGQHQDHDDYDACDEDPGVPHLRLELCGHIVHVHAGAEDPAPGLKQLDVRSLFHRIGGAGLGPAIVDQTGALAFDDGDHFVEHRETVRVSDGRQVLAF